jgi:cell division protein FtsN
VAVSSETNAAAPLSDIASNDLSAPQAAPKAVPFKTGASVPPPAVTASVTPPPAVADSGDEGSPFDVIAPAQGQEPEPLAPKIETAAAQPVDLPKRSEPANEPPIDDSKVYVQLGAFKNALNAEHLKDKYLSISDLKVVKKTQANGDILYHVRTGPYGSNQQGEYEISKLKAAGAEAKIVKE